MQMPQYIKLIDPLLNAAEVCVCVCVLIRCLKQSLIYLFILCATQIPLFPYYFQPWLSFGRLSKQQVFQFNRMAGRAAVHAASEKGFNLLPFAEKSNRVS